MRLCAALTICLLASLADASIADDSPPRRLAAPLLPAEPYSYAVTLPPHLQSLRDLEAPPTAFEDDDEIATLGRVLFHDRTLSKNTLVSCASCHTQAQGFDDPTRFSIGFEGRITRRASMTLTNARFVPAGRYFRDERAPSLEAQVLMPFTDPVEMGLVAGELVDRVSALPFYPPLFAAAYGSPQISEPKIAAALAQYVRAIVSTRSRYDEQRALAPDPMVDFAGFTRQENRGKQLFLKDRGQGGAGCAACHAGEGFVLRAATGNGLAPGPDRDRGIAESSGEPADEGRFRVGTLRNIAVTAPYMHDGRFPTLEAVIDHYADGVTGSVGLDPLLRGADARPARLMLTPEDRSAVVAFLRTLTDDTLLRDPRFSDPFIERPGN